MISIQIKRKVIQDLISSVTEKPTEKDFSEVAKKYNLKREQVKYYWKNNLKKGKPDLRKQTGYGTIILTPKISKLVPGKKREISQKEAAEILLKYLTEKDMPSKFMIKYNLCRYQFYSLMNELQVYGTVLGKKVLDPKKYWKNYNIFDVFRLAKNSKSKSKSILFLDEDTKNAYINLIKILKIWLGKRAGYKKKEIDLLLQK